MANNEIMSENYLIQGLKDYLWAKSGRPHSFQHSLCHSGPLQNTTTDMLFSVSSWILNACISIIMNYFWIEKIFWRKWSCKHKTVQTMITRGVYLSDTKLKKYLNDTLLGSFWHSLSFIRFSFLIWQMNIDSIIKAKIICFGRAE